MTANQKNDKKVSKSMSKLFYRTRIEDIVNTKCTDTELNALLDVFEYTVKKMAITLARKSWYELKDYATAKQRGIDRFTMMLERKDILGQEQWYGIFLNDNKSLSVIGTLEKN